MPRRPTKSRAATTPPNPRGNCLRGHLRAALLAVLLGLGGPATPGLAVARHPAYTVIDLGTLRGPHSAAYGINALGHVVGAADADPRGDSLRAFLYAGGVLRDLGTLPGGGGSEASAINVRDQVAGDVGTRGSDRHAARYDRGRWHDLGTLGGSTSEALAIDDRGEVVGDADTRAPFVAHAFLYAGGRMRDLGTLGDPHDAGGSDSLANGINGRGQVVGVTDVRHGPANGHAFLYEGGRMRELGTLPGTGASASAAMAIDDRGEVVGYVLLGGGRERAFLYADGTMYDLTRSIPATAGWTLDEATAINDAGEIVGIGTVHGRTHAFLLRPVR